MPLEPTYSTDPRTVIRNIHRVLVLTMDLVRTFPDLDIGPRATMIGLVVTAVTLSERGPAEDRENFAKMLEEYAQCLREGKRVAEAAPHGNA